jgi:hypothetical protein
MIHGWKHRYKLLKSIGEGLKVTLHMLLSSSLIRLQVLKRLFHLLLSRCLGSLHVLLGGNKRLNTLIR